MSSKKLQHKNGDHGNGNKYLAGRAGQKTDKRSKTDSGGRLHIPAPGKLKQYMHPEKGPQ